MTKCGFSGGRENTPFAELVPSNYYAAKPGEVCVRISGDCSVATLRGIVAWAEENTELVRDDNMWPEPGWRKVKEEK